jgi:hypothetical protein
VRIGYDARLLHSVDVGIRGTPEDLAAVRQVTYTFLPDAIDAQAWAAGDAIPDVAGSTVMVVTERDETEDGLAFARRRETLGWLPVQIVATVAREREGIVETLRLGPFGPELADPSIAVRFRPVYEETLMAGEAGLVRMPALTSIELHFVGADRPGALETIDRVGVAIGRTGNLHGVNPSFETFTADELREAKGRLHLGSIDNRRGVMVVAEGDPRDFIWVVAVDVRGRAESYATWRPRFLRESLTPEAARNARAGEELSPFMRTDPVPAESP